MTRVPAYVSLALSALVPLVLAGCGADSIVAVSAGSHSQSVTAAIGQEVDVTLGNVGPAIYTSPPAISSDAVTFLDVNVIPPYTPGGPTQRFRFKATAAGQAVITFSRVLESSVVATVVDTVQVR
ncbi:MAG TPA: hypothetical protein VGM67_06230 [Gemmatimonadaceae bacterium]|jgi:hypothetical protein